MPLPVPAAVVSPSPSDSQESIDQLKVEEEEQQSVRDHHRSGDWVKGEVADKPSMDHQDSICLVKIEESDDPSSSNSWSSNDWVKGEVEQEAKDCQFSNKLMKLPEGEEPPADDYKDESRIVKVEDEEIPIEYCQESKNHWKNEVQEKPSKRDPQDFMKFKDGEEGLSRDHQESVEEGRIQNSTEDTHKKRRSPREEGPRDTTELVTKAWTGNARWGFSNMLQTIEAVKSSAWLKEKMPDYDEKGTASRIRELGKEKMPENKSDLCYPVDFTLHQSLRRSNTNDEKESNAGNETALSCKQSTRVNWRPDAVPGHENISTERGQPDIYRRMQMCENPDMLTAYERKLNSKLNPIVPERGRSPAKPFQCPQCEKSFIQRSHLAQHERTHSGQRPYQCHECKKTFSQKFNLTKHEKTHTGQKPYQCSGCEKSFSEKCNLVQHEKLHTGEKPYRCSECGKTFSEKYNLTKHMKTHTGQKPFQCSECNKIFTWKSSLTMHEKNTQDSTAFRALNVGKAFDREPV